MIIFGSKTYVSVLAIATVLCGRCHNPAAHRLQEVKRKFTLFFVPLFAFSTKHVLDCTFCGARSSLSQAEADAFVAEHAQAGSPPV